MFPMMEHLLDVCVAAVTDGLDPLAVLVTPDIGSRAKRNPVVVSDEHVLRDHIRLLGSIGPVLGALIRAVSAVDDANDIASAPHVRPAGAQVPVTHKTVLDVNT